MKSSFNVLLLASFISIISAQVLEPRQDSATPSRSIPLPTFTLQISTLDPSLQSSIDQLSTQSISLASTDPNTNSFSRSSSATESVATTGIITSDISSITSSASSTTSSIASTTSSAGMGDGALGLKVPNVGGPLVVAVAAVFAGALAL